MSEIHAEMLRRWLREREIECGGLPCARNEALRAAIVALEVAPLCLSLMESARPLVLNLERLKEASK